MIAQILSAVLGVLAFAILFHAPRRSYLACALCGGFSWGMYLAFTALGLSEFLASALSIIALTLLARILSVAMMMPATVFIVTGIFPIVPGAGIYYTAYSLIVSDMAMFQQKSLETLTLAGAIAIGILMGMGLPRAIPRVSGLFLRRFLPDPADRKSGGN
ncbi:MAG: threonine/serine exporter family protein [Clostridia bacterium]|nr:threonine/serine exporter family protein [Clostridia bacterium]